MTEDIHSLVPLIVKAVSGEALTADEAKAGFDRMMAGQASPVRIGALLTAMQTKGLAPSEIAGGVRALQAAMVPVSAEAEMLVDTCGTGGGSVTTFNISTAAALVAAGGGIRVAKHGNRSFTSKCGSADVLEALGVRIELSPEGMSRVLEEVGIVFMYAPLLHPAMRHVGPVRRELGLTTIMNLLGPLTNPAGARRQVVGVADPSVLDLVVEGLAELGHDRAMVVHGEPGMDELSPCGVTRVAELVDGDIQHYEVTPESLGLRRVEAGDLAGGAPEENAEILRAILEGRKKGAVRTAVSLNAAAAFYVAGQASSLRDGVEAAGAAIDSGAALAALEGLIEASCRYPA